MINKCKISLCDFPHIYSVARAISTSDLAAILLFPVVGRRRNHLGTLFELAMVGKLQFVSTVTTILIPDLICNISQRDHEISPF